MLLGSHTPGTWVEIIFSKRLIFIGTSIKLPWFCLISKGGIYKKDDQLILWLTLGVTKPEEYGGLGLDFSYSIAFNEALGHVNCGAVPMSIAVQTDMSTPALAK